MSNKAEKRELAPKLRFPEFREAGEWESEFGDVLFDQISNKDHNSDLPVLAITQEQGAIPRNLIDYHVSVTEKSIESYKVVEVGDFIISLRSFQGGIEYSSYKGICSPAYVILRLKAGYSAGYFKHFLKTSRFIALLTKNLEGLRDGKMVSYKQFSELRLPTPSRNEQQKIADCLASLDELITVEAQKLDTLKTHKKGLMQQLFPAEGETLPKLRFPEFQNAGEWDRRSIDALVEDGLLEAPRDGNHGNIHPKSSDYVSKGIPFVMASDIRNGEVNYEQCVFIRKEQADSLQKGFALEGDVLLTHKGTVGAVAVVGKIGYPYIMLTPQVTYYRVRDKGRLLNRFLAQTFTSDVFQAPLLVAAGGGTRSYIGITEQAKLFISIPVDIGEQNKVADCLTSLDDLITAQAQKLAALKTHKKGLMQQLFPALESDREVSHG
jgi:type I restriction enzyme S subunit